MGVRHLSGDCRAILPTLPAESVHCVVTSPPYFGLRDYGTGQWEGGDPACGHAPTQEWIDHNFNAQSVLGLGHKTQGAAAKLRWFNGDGSCRCGAQRTDRQIGLEATPEAYVAELVGVFREVRRVLRRDGTLWLNLGDSYAGGGTIGRNDTTPDALARRAGKYGTGTGNGSAVGAQGIRQAVAGLKPKDLIGIPWMVAFALRADGWYLRQEIIWHKLNPMPESVRDRCTKAHEQIFLLTKSANYYFDAEAIAEDAVGSRGGAPLKIHDEAAQGRHGATSALNKPWDGASSRNRRSVWTVATAPFSEAHFATFPPALIEPCIKAGVPERCCAGCGAPWVRETGRDVDARDVDPSAIDRFGNGSAGVHRKIGSAYQKWMDENPKRTLGFSPSCACEAGTVPGTVLDPFGGAGTTGLVADRLQRNAILIELNEDYAGMSERRVSEDRGPLLELMG